MTGVEACARAALEADFDPVPWDQAPAWRRKAAEAVARSAIEQGTPDHARAAWLASMVEQGWRWGHVLDERAMTHPGVKDGELTRGGTAHWTNVVRQVRIAAAEYGVRVTG